MLRQRRRRRANIKPPSVQRLVFAGIIHNIVCTGVWILQKIKIPQNIENRVIF